MPDYLITYDLKETDPKPHKPLLTAAEKEGLLYVWQGASFVNRLPNTTLWGTFSTATAANEAFERALVEAAKVVGRTITLEKRATTQMGDTSVKSDVRKKPLAKWTGRNSFETCRLHQLNDPDFK